MRFPAHRPALFALAALLAGCSGTSARYAVPDAPVSETRVAVRYGAVAIREVSLPTYASSEEIYRRGPEGALVSSPDVLWADDPVREMTGDLARYLGRITRATVAAEPWPFFERADATVEVRVADMLAEADGRFRLTGQYFVAPDSGARGRSGAFDIEVPIAEAGGPLAIAEARGAAVRDLATQIAREGLR